MSDFTVIETQEQLDAVIGDRLKRNEEKWQKKYEGYLSPDEVLAKTSELEKQLKESTNAFDGLNKKYSEMEKSIADYEGKIKSHEISALKHKIAHDKGLSYDAIDFLQGNDEETITASADKFKSLVGKTHNSPSFSNEPDVSSKANDSVKKLAQSLTNK